MRDPRYLDGAEILDRAFQRFTGYGSYSKDLAIDEEFIKSAASELESSLDNAVTIAARLMIRIVNEKPIPPLPTRLGASDGHRQVNERFAFVLGLALIGIDAYLVDKDAPAAKELGGLLDLKDSLNVAALEFCLQGISRAASR